MRVVRRAVVRLGVRVLGSAAHLPGMNSDADARNLRLRVTRRDEPDLGKLIEWVLNIAEARHRAWVAGEPDPYGLQLPDELAEAPQAFPFVGGARENREQAPLPQGGPP